MLLLEILAIVLEAVLAVQVGYLLLLTLAAFAAPRTTAAGVSRSPILHPEKGAVVPTVHLAVLIPAHNEERLLPELLASMQAQDYPRHLMDLFVVADNCTDRTAEIGRQMGARVFERFNTSEVGKGYALNWLLQQINALPTQASAFDAFVILDADTTVSPGFMRVMDARLQGGANVIQGYYAVRSPDRVWGVALRFAALAVLHYLRPLGRCLLGGSAGLKGNGMCFRANLYQKYAWSGSVTEDIEYHMTLLLAGERVEFAPDATLEAEMPGTLQSSSTQNVRWESGRLQAARAHMPALWRRLTRSAPKPFIYLDAMMEHLIPPTAVLIFLIGVCLVLGGLIAWLGSGWAVLWVGVALLAGLAAYILCGLWMVRAPGKVWLSLLYAPFYALWKIVLLGRIVLGKKKQGWVRTER